MIPKKIIERAIAGGWNNILADIVQEADNAEAPFYFKAKSEGRQNIRWEAIALDPDFWMALSKERGWLGVWRIYFYDKEGNGTAQYYFRGDEKIVGTDTKTQEKTERWVREISLRTGDDPVKFNAHRLLDLILRKASQEEIDAYWQSLASQPESTQPLTAKGETS